MKKLQDILKEKILVLDGAMGTEIQKFNLSESDFRGEIFENHGTNLKGCNDILVLTKPDVISNIHKQYLDAGADIIETCSFNANAISLADYDLCDYAYRIAFESAILAKEAVEAYNLYDHNKPRFVAGSIGPTNKSLALAKNIDKPAERDVSFDELASAYFDQARGLIDGGVDILLVETIFDTLNAKAALYAITELSNTLKKHIPVMISLTLDKGGRTLSGQSIEAFVASISHYPILSIGLNCSFGAGQMKPYLAEISKYEHFYTSAYPNAGMPNEMGEYEETPDTMADFVKELLEEKLVNIIGGCCGTSPAHIAAIAKISKDFEARKIEKNQDKNTENTETLLAGLELLHIDKTRNFVNIGEQTNVAGSRKFARLIREKNYQEALSIARNQIENGAQMLDVCLDDGMIDAKEEIKNFLNCLSSESDIAKLPLVIDSSDFEVIIQGLKCCQGKPLVNSINLKDGDDAFLSKAKKIRELGAAVVVMLFDEDGQATTVEHKVKIAERAYKLLQTMNFPSQDIIFDLNILAIATGMSEHNDYAKNFIEACQIIKNLYPSVKISGGVSNLSFSFRGNDTVRSMLHSVFLFHAINAGMDMGIVNAGKIIPYSQIPERQRIIIENAIFNKSDDAAEKLLKLAEEASDDIVAKTEQRTNWRNLPVKERINYSFLNGISNFIEEDLNELIENQYLGKEINIVEQELMPALDIVGEQFASGKLFLPQIVKAAKVMQKSVNFLKPFIEKNKISATKQKKKILFATVKGDVHDIGKNIASVVFSCNGYEIIDLGVMVPKEKILEETLRNKVDVLCLSGLITPSLKEMEEVAIEYQKQGITIPIVVGGASTSILHTAIHLNPKYEYGVFYAKDVAAGVNIVNNLTNSDKKEAFVKEIQSEYQKLKSHYEENQKIKNLLTLEEARKKKLQLDWQKVQIIVPQQLGIKIWKNKSFRRIIPYIDWRNFFTAWELKSQKLGQLSPEAKILFDDAIVLLEELVKSKKICANAVFGIFESNSEDENLFIKKLQKHSSKGEKMLFPLQRNRNRKNEKNLSLADFIASKESGRKDYIAAYVCSAGIGLDKTIEKFKNDGDFYKATLLQTLAARLTEALTEFMHKEIRTRYWAFAKNENLSIQELHHERYQGIRAAVGYPALPEHSLKRNIFDLLDIEKNIGVHLTENFMMIPEFSACGLIFANEAVSYFSVE